MTATTAPTRPGTRVVFELSRVVPLPPEQAWHRLTDWAGHGEWIPMTRVEVDPADPNRFVAWSGVGPLMLEDRMHAIEQHFDGRAGQCRVHKLGPILVGEAEFAVWPGLRPDSSIVHWREDVSVPVLPRFLAPLAAWVGRVLFSQALARMA